MSRLTLDAIRSAADSKYASTEIEMEDGFIVTMVNPLRLPEDRRNALTALQDELEAAGSDLGAQALLLEKAVRTAVLEEKAADRLVAFCNGDMALLATVFESYSAGTELGEA